MRTLNLPGWRVKDGVISSNCGSNLMAQAFWFTGQR